MVLICVGSDFLVFGCSCIVGDCCVFCVGWGSVVVVRG